MTRAPTHDPRPSTSSAGPDLRRAPQEDLVGQHDAIVVGVRADGAPEPALDFALQEAGRRRRAVHVVHAYGVQVYAEEPTVDWGGLVGEVRAAALDRTYAALNQATGRCGHHGVPTVVTVVESDVVPALAQAAQGAALLVVGSRGGGALRRGTRGSVSAGCLHDVAVPVAVVPDRSRAGGDRGPCRVVVGYDGSPAADAALMWGVVHAREWGCDLVPVVVSTSRVRPPPGLAADVAASGASLETVVRSRLDRAGSRGSGVRAHCLIGTPVEQLRRVVRPGDLLVVGSRGHGALASLLIGSTSLTLAESLSCPVVVVRSGHQTPVAVRPPRSSKGAES